VSVENLLTPVDLATFLSRYYEREPLVINRASPDHFDGFLTVERLDEIIASNALTTEDVLVVDDSRAITVDDYANDEGQVDSRRVQQLFSQGATISLRHLQARIPSLARLCRAAERVFSCTFQANVYFTPPEARGFRTHHDTHDVFVLQIAGSKRWRLYSPQLRLPLPGQRYFWNSSPSASAALETHLCQGDLLYCPRGTPHDAQATGESSVHISLGALATTWAELLLETVADVALRDAALRGALPPGYVTDGIATQILRQKLHELLARVEQRARPDLVLAGLAERFIAAHPAVMDGHRSTLIAASDLSSNSRVACRAGLVYRIVERRTRVTLMCNGQRLSMPVFAATPLRYALETEAFQVRDLPGALSESGKIVLVRRLMTAGAVVALSN
jgi:ribosomal protein L16 Arg81 hydroxylase